MDDDDADADDADDADDDDDDDDSVIIKSKLSRSLLFFIDHGYMYLGYDTLIKGAITSKTRWAGQSPT